MKQKHTGMAVGALGIVGLTAVLAHAAFGKDSTVERRRWGADMPQGSSRAIASAHGRLVVRADALRKQARAMLASGDLPGAERKLLDAVSILREDPLTWSLLADVCERRGEQGAALEAYRELVFPQGWASSVSADPTTHMRYVLALARNNRWAEARTVYTDTARTAELRIHGVRVGTLPASDQLDRRSLLAAAHLYLGCRGPSFERANSIAQEAHLAQAVNLRPRWAIAHYAYGIRLAADRYLEPALREFRVTVELGDDTYSTQALEAIDRIKRASAQHSKSPVDIRPSILRQSRP